MTSISGLLLFIEILLSFLLTVLGIKKYRHRQLENMYRNQLKIQEKAYRRIYENNPSEYRIGDIEYFAIKAAGDSSYLKDKYGAISKDNYIRLN